ncbi:AfsR/SARP family transcriptional regulator [Amycolatopsis anabasis]|uniref:AfsR/SARP family transcriptional regulator n=1 Tax=Amycolatopsis anabasis TaxID=1840409 RepID=UPI00131A80DE|nr:BTAD domain-containing putative transcriptional regulator [Amycolatopsis anabasis]
MDEGDAGSVSVSELRFQLLGPVRLLIGARPVPIGGPSVRGLLALLALHANKVVPLDDLIDALWGHDPPATARTIVHGNVSHLRRVLRSIQAHGADAVRIRTAAPGYQLTVDESRIDVHRARALLERADGEPLEKRAELLAEAFALWQGPALAGVPDSMHAPELDDLRLAVHGARVDAELALGRHAELIAELTAMVRENPLAERTVGQLMRALYYSGRRAEALDVYRRFSRHAADTLGIDAGPELHALHERVLNDDLPPVGDPAPETGPRVGVGHLVPAQLPPAVPVLSGRRRETDWLDGLLGRSELGAGVVGVVTGTAGVGKTALVVSWAHRASARFPDGVLFAALRGFDPNHPPLPAADVLTQFLLGLGVAPAELPERADERVALYRSLLAERRVLVLLDDARSADQVRPLLPPGQRSMAVVTSRARLDGLAVSNAAKVYRLDTLPPRDAKLLISELAGEDPGDQHGRLAQLCGYLPLALRLAGARLAASPQWTAEDLVGELANERTRLVALDVAGADTSVRAALDVSFRGLPADVATTFRSLGALHCPSFSPYLVAALADTDVADARRRLRVLAAHHLLTETRRDSFAAHDLVRLYARDLAESELSGPERADVLGRCVRYHQAAADRARRRLLRPVDQLDFTEVLAGDEAPELDGVGDALSWFADEWANLQATLGQASAAGRHDDVWRLARVMHTYRLARPLWDDWFALVETGLAAARESGDRLAQFWMRISRCAVRVVFEVSDGILADAEAAFEIATELGDDRLLVTATIHVGCALAQEKRYDEAISWQQRAMADASRIGDEGLHTQALHNCAWAESQAGRYSEAIEHQRSALEIDQKLGDDSYVVGGLNNLAEMCLGVGDLAEAERWARQAIELSRTRDFTLQEGVARLFLGRTLRASGDVAGARAEFARSLELHERVSPQLVHEVRGELETLSPARA